VKHFSDSEWADFARNAVAPAKKTTMQTHINHDCKKCSATLALWEGVRSITRQESAFLPPEGIVRIVKTQFLAMTPEPKTGLCLLFDSDLQPLAAGIRGSSVSARQLLYETDDFYIDLRVERHREAERASLVGQVLHRVGEARSTEGVVVSLKKGTLPLAETTANRFGEFQLDFDPANGLCIAIRGSKHDEIILPLYGMHTEPVEGKDLD